MKRRDFLITATTAMTGVSLAHAADDFPVRPLRLVLPFGAGGSIDRIGRAFADGLAAELGQTVVVINQPGAGGNLGHQSVVAAPPDGYTLLLTATGPMAINPSLHRKLSFKPTDFDPIVTLSLAPFMLATRTASPWRSVAELVTAARGKPGRISFASTGIGTSNHLAAMLFQSLTKTSLLHVPYKEVGQATTGLVGGEVDLMFYQPFIFMPLISSGKLKPYAVTGSARSRVAPDVPTFAETGVAGMNVTVWSAIVAPRNLPSNVRARLSEAGERVTRGSGFQQLLVDVGEAPLLMPTNKIGEFFASESTRWEKVVKETGTVAD